MDVNFFQNKKLFQTNFHDHLASEWNVYHFHLSIKLEAKGSFFKKTNSLLFCYIIEKKAILLDIDSHGNGVFANEKWLKILDDYYPDILEPYIDRNIKDIRPQLTPIERQTIWNNGLTIGMTEINGKIIHSPGIGRATSGHSLKVTKTASAILRWIWTISVQFENNRDKISQYYELNPEETHFKVQFRNSGLEVIDLMTGKSLICFPSIFEFKLT